MGAAPIGLPVFLLAALASLGASWVLASRIERLGTHFRISEALLGVIAALAADSPEITSAITAFGNRQGTVGAGVVLGSNVFNLAALLGLSALIADRIHLHRRVVLLSGAVGAWVAGVSVLAALGSLSSVASLVLVLCVLVPYVVVLGVRRARVRRLGLPKVWADWLVRAIAEEERELAEGETHRPFRRRDLWVTGVSVAIVVGASVTMERSASSLGRHYSVSDLAIGALVLAGVTSLPNAVMAMCLAVRGRGTAILSTALNSNALNVALGWLLPATIAGVAVRTAGGALVGCFYLGLTVGSLAIAYYAKGLDRRAGVAIIGTYFGFAGAVLASGGVSAFWLALGLFGAMVMVTGVGLTRSA
jgi:cation:H+ antiporter